MNRESAKAGYFAAQELALKSVREVGELMQEGWTEIETAKLVETYLRDYGVKSFFHKPFVWFGENTRFRNVKRYRDFQPTERRLQRGEVVILDVAPIFHGYVCDVGYTTSLGPNAELDEAMSFLAELKPLLCSLFESKLSGSEIWRQIDARIQERGYDNIHSLYPFSVLGHRVHQVQEQGQRLGLLNFGWQSYWSLLSRGLFRELLAPESKTCGPGMWAIEPHIGTKSFGAKFEEILVFDGEKAYWLSERTPHEA